MLNVEFHGDPENPLHVRANYTIQILPTVLQDVFYELCSLTLRTIFDLRIPGATIPIKQLLSIPSGILSAPTCPAMNATETSITQGFSCSDGEILKMNAADKGELPECSEFKNRLNCTMWPSTMCKGDSVCTEHMYSMSRRKLSKQRRPIWMQGVSRRHVHKQPRWVTRLPIREFRIKGPSQSLNAFRSVEMECSV